MLLKSTALTPHVGHDAVEHNSSQLIRVEAFVHHVVNEPTRLRDAECVSPFENPAQWMEPKG